MNEHHPNFLRIVNVLKPMLRAYPPLSVLTFDDLADYMSWYWNRGTMSWVISEEGEPQGVCLIRLFRRLEQFIDHNVHEPCGEFCLIELLASSDPVTTGLLHDGLVDRWGAQKIMMFDRGARTENGAPHMYTWEQFRKISRRMSYGLVHA
jgi:hypothetical protein